jgi:hypothetical protein
LSDMAAVRTRGRGGESREGRETRDSQWWGGT